MSVYSELTIAAMLGHAAGLVTSRYVHLDEAVQSAVERVSNEILGLLDASVRPASTPARLFGYLGSPLVTGSCLLTGLVTVRSVAAA